MGTQPSSPKRGRSPPKFAAHVYCGQTAGWIKIPLGTKVDLGPGRIVLHGDPAPLPKGAQTPNFRPMSIVAKRWAISATTEHLWEINSVCILARHSLSYSVATPCYFFLLTTTRAITRRTTVIRWITRTLEVAPSTFNNIYLLWLWTPACAVTRSSLYIVICLICRSVLSSLS